MSSIDRKKIKSDAKKVLKLNYFKSIIVAFLVALVINGGYNYVTLKYQKNKRVPVSFERKNNFKIIDETVQHILNKESDGNEENLSGVVAPIVNNITKSKSISLGFLNSINILLFKNNISAGIVSLLSGILSFFIYFFIRNVIKVGSNRYFLEQRIYSDTYVHKILFPFRVKRLLNISFILFLKELFLMIWNITIVGGFIKHYEYLMIPYILSENPDINYKDAFALSKNMMHGNKWNSFKLDLSIFGYYVLKVFTIGISGMFYSDAYIECIYAELYVNLRKSKQKNYSKYFNDKYLITKYENTNVYPEDKFPLPMVNIKISHLDYEKNYNICTYILFFFTFAFFGWAWEVFYHLLLDGTFVNRGTMFGPWLPIYGFGGIFILVLLKPIREKPLLFLICCMLVAGILEYSTAWYLETFKHMKWWDYTGYFLNIKGRICLEGLFVFALGGAAITYFVSPLLDNIYSKIKLNIKLTVCVILSLFFAIDLVYSSIHPNVGKGITFFNKYNNFEKVFINY